MGWPLGAKTGGGSFMYHLEDNLVSIGLVVHLNYDNPYLYPYMEFQRFKHHPLIEPVLRGGRRVAYGARAITEGGFQSVPKLYLPRRRADRLLGGLRQRAAHQGLAQRHEDRHAGGGSRLRAPSRRAAPATNSATMKQAYENSWVYQDLKRVRNVKPMWSKLGLVGGLALGGLDMWMNQLFGFGLGTWKHGKPDYATLKPAAESKPIDYPKPDGVISFDRLTNLAFSGTNHEEDQKVHLQLQEPGDPDRREPADLCRARPALLPGRRL